MIHRIVLLKLTDEWSRPESRLEVADHTRRALPDMPGVRAVTVGVPADEGSARSWDISITATFDRLEDVAPYLAHPEHRSYVDEYLEPRLVCIKAWNFEV